MSGDQQKAAKIRTAKFLKNDPDYFKRLAARRKGTPNPSSTKFTSKVAAIFGSKGGKAPRKRRTDEQIKHDREILERKIAKKNETANRQFRDSYDKKYRKEGFKGDV